MKRNLPFIISGIFFLFLFSCSHKSYVTSTFDQKTVHHKLVAVLPAEMIFTGKQPEKLSPEDIAKIEEQESKNFQMALYNSILEHANTRKHFTFVNFQDATTTQKLLEDHNIQIRDSWKTDDKELKAILGVDAIVRMRIQKQRYMSDLASYGISVGRQIITNTGIGSKIPVPYVRNKTNDIYASCNVVSDNETLWNDYYKRSSDWDSPADVIIEDIADNFGKHFPYKRRK